MSSYGNVVHDILRTQKTLLDTNNDQQIDYWRSFNSKGQITEIRKDINFDQKIDYVKSIKTNKEESTQIDSDFNGFFETTHLITYKNRDPRKEIIAKDRNEDGKVDFRKILNYQYRNMRILVLISKDENYDGQFEEKTFSHRLLDYETSTP